MKYAWRLIKESGHLSQDFKHGQGRFAQAGRWSSLPHWGHETMDLSERRARLVWAVIFMWQPVQTSCSTDTTARAFFVSKRRS